MQQINLKINNYDNTFSSKEIKLIDELLFTSIKNDDLISEEELNKILLN